MGGSQNPTVANKCFATNQLSIFKYINYKWKLLYIRIITTTIFLWYICEEVPKIVS
jgi:hypothetical protein